MSVEVAHRYSDPNSRAILLTLPRVPSYTRQRTVLSTPHFPGHSSTRVLWSSNSGLSGLAGSCPVGKLPAPRAGMRAALVEAWLGHHRARNGGPVAPASLGGRLAEIQFPAASTGVCGGQGVG
jgi:hypothetical protein